jgi:hypothetical protein
MKLRPLVVALAAPLVVSIAYLLGEALTYDGLYVLTSGDMLVSSEKIDEDIVLLGPVL